MERFLSSPTWDGSRCWAGTWQALPVLLDLGIHGTGAAGEALTAALPVLELHREKSLALRSQDQDPQVAEALAAGQPDWQSALDAVHTSGAGLGTPELPAAGPTLGSRG